MASKQLFFTNRIVNNALALQDGGVPPAAGWSTTGWTLGTTPAGSFSRMLAGSEVATFQLSDALTPPSFAANSCWRSEQPFSGRFAPGEWAFAFRIRSQKVSGQSGRVNCRIWRSASGVGIPSLELTPALALGSTVSGLSGSTSQTSLVLFPAVPAVTFVNEYLFVQCEWEVQAPATQGTANLLFYIDAAVNVTTTDFALPLVPLLYNDIDEKFIAPSPIVSTVRLGGPIVYDDVEAEFAAFPPTVSGTTIVRSLALHLDEEAVSTAMIWPGPATMAVGGVFDDPDVVWTSIVGPNDEFPMVVFIDRFTEAEYNLFRQRMRGIQFMGPGINKKFDTALVTGFLDVADPMMPEFKRQMVVQGILSDERADIIFAGLVR